MPEQLNLTPVELAGLERYADPNRHDSVHGLTRQSLRRKGLIEERPRGGWKVTAAGRRVLGQRLAELPRQDAAARVRSENYASRAARESVRGGPLPPVRRLSPTSAHAAIGRIVMAMFELLDMTSPDELQRVVLSLIPVTLAKSEVPALCDAMRAAGAVKAADTIEQAFDMGALERLQ